MFYHKTIINLVFPVLNIILTHMVNTQKVYGWIQSIVTALNSMEILTGINAQSQSQCHGLVECGQVLLLFSDGEKIVLRYKCSAAYACVLQYHYCCEWSITPKRLSTPK